MDCCTGAGGLAGGGGGGGGGAAAGGGGGGMAAGGGIIISSLQAAAKKRIKERLASFALVVRVIIFMHLRYAQDAPGDALLRVMVPQRFFSNPNCFG
jgi:hypothetical protein